MSGTIRLKEIAHARSGDKGNHANVGVIAYTQTGYEFLGRELTADRMAEFAKPLGATRVERFAMPGILAYNFVLENALAGGASRSLKADSQGKLLALAVLEMELPRPPDLERMRPTEPLPRNVMTHSIRPTK
jgi:hypothetical protein